MTNLSDKNDREKRNTMRSGEKEPPTAEEAFKRATDLHQNGNIADAMSLYRQIVEHFPYSPKAELSKTLIAGMQKEKIKILWDTAWDVRLQCKAQEAIKLYRMIIEESPSSPEAKSAKTEITNLSDLLQLWNEALSIQSQGNESKAVGVYRQIIERSPNSPEAENAGLMMAIIGQNQLMPRGEVTQDFKFGKNTPEMILSHFLAHRKSTSGNANTPSKAAEREEQNSKQIESLWTQAVALEKNGNIDEAVILYKKIISSSANGHRVRDAKYQIEKIRSRSKEAQRTYDMPKAWGLMRDDRTSLLQKIGRGKVLAAVAVLAIIAVVGVLAFSAKKPPAWTDVVEDAKRSIVVVKATTGAGTGFFISSNGLIITNAQVVGKDKEVAVRLYSGMMKRASVVKAGLGLLDVTVLKLEGSNDKYLTMAESDECEEGAEIRVLGAPLGMEYFITKGIISHCNIDQDGVKYIQTDPSLNVGNSGGPCLSSKGKVIGITTSVPLGNSGKSLNLILPITTVKLFMEGKLTALEEILTKKEEERTRELEESKKLLYANIEDLNRRLQRTVSNERTAYLTKVIDLLNRNQVTKQQADLMVERVSYGPSGSILMADWVQSLAMKVVKGDMSEDSAIKLIKEQFKM